METRQGREARSGRAGRAWIRREGREGGPFSRRLIGPIERGQGRRADLGGLVVPGDRAGKGGPIWEGW